MGKLSAEQIKEIIEAAGYTHAGGDYKNLKTMLLCKCENGHQTPFSVEDLRKQPFCPQCREGLSLDKKETNIGQKRKKKGRRILAIDNATKTSGWAVIENGEPIESGIFQTLKDSSPTERIVEVGQWMKGMMHAWDIDALGLEDVTGQGNPQTLILLSKLLGHLEALGFMSLATAPFICSPSSWRSYCKIGGKTRAQKKELAQDYVRKRFGIVASQDRAEAICIGIYVSSLDKFSKDEISW